MADQDLTGRTIEADDDAPLPTKAKDGATEKSEAKPAQKTEERQERDPDDPSVKIDRLRAAVRTAEKNFGSERAERQRLAEETRALRAELEELKKERLSQKDREEAAELRERAKIAMQTGDHEQLVKTTEEIADLRAEQKLREREQREDEAADGEPLSDGDMRALRRWQDAKGEDGEFLRPWARPDSEHFSAVQALVRKVSAEMAESDPDATVAELLMEVDQRIQALSRKPARRDEGGDDEAPARRSAPLRTTVRPNNGGKPGPLSTMEQRAAEAMLQGGLAKNRQEAHQMYAKARTEIGRKLVVEE